MARLGTGHTPDRANAEYWQDCTIPWVTIADIQRLSGLGLDPLEETEQHISELGLRNSAAVLHPAGTVMLSRTASIGYSCRIGRPMATTQAFVTWTPTAAIDSRFLLLAVKALGPELERLAYGSTHKTIYMPDISDLRIPLPPRASQIQIADFVGAQTARIDALIAKKRRMMELAEIRYRAGRIALLRSREGAVPMPLRRLVMSAPGGAWGSEPGVDEADALCVRVADFDRATAMTSSEITTVRSFPSSQLKRLELRAGDLLLEKSGGGDKQPVGFVAAFRGTSGRAVCSNFVARMRPETGFDPGYLRHLFAAVYDAGLSVPYIKQTTGIQNLDVGAFLSQKWPVTKDSLQQRAVARKLDHALDIAVRLADALRRQNDLLMERRQALITAAVSGQLPDLA